MLCFRLLVLPVPGQVGQAVHGGDDGEHDQEAQEEIGGQDVQHRGGGLRAGHVEVVGTGDELIGPVGDAHQDQQSHIGADDGLGIGPHAVDEDHVEHGDVAEGVLDPKLPVAQAGGAAVGQGRGGQQGEDRAAEEPEVDDVEELLVLAHDHVAAENGGPAADGDGQVVHGVGPQLRQSHQTPVVGHLRADQGKGHAVAELFLVLAGADAVGVFADQQNHRDHGENGREMGGGEQGKLRGVALTPEIDQKFLHDSPLFQYSFITK